MCGITRLNIRVLEIIRLNWNFRVDSNCEFERWIEITRGKELSLKKTLSTLRVLRENLCRMKQVDLSFIGFRRLTVLKLLLASLSVSHATLTRLYPPFYIKLSRYSERHGYTLITSKLPTPNYRVIAYIHLKFEVLVICLIICGEYYTTVNTLKDCSWY